jgi:hypothetical protein
MILILNIGCLNENIPSDHDLVTQDITLQIALLSHYNQDQKPHPDNTKNNLTTLVNIQITLLPPHQPHHHENNINLKIPNHIFLPLKKKDAEPVILYANLTLPQKKTKIIPHSLIRNAQNALEKIHFKSGYMKDHY